MHFFWAIHEPRLNTVCFVVHCALHHIASNSSSSSLCSCDIGCSVPGNCCADYADECSAESQYPVKLELSSETQFVAALGSDKVPQAAGLVASVTGKMMQRITEHNTPKLVTTPYSGEVSTIVCTADNCEEGTTFNMSGHGKLHRVKESLTSTVIGGTTLSMGEIEKQNLPMIMDAFFTLWLDPQWISPALFNIAYGLHFMHMENPWSHLPVTPMYVEKWFRSMHGFSLSTEQSHYGVGITGGMLDDTQPENNYEFGVRYFGGKLRADNEVVDFSSVGLSQDWKQFVDVIVVDIVRENRTTTTTTTTTSTTTTTVFNVDVNVTIPSLDLSDSQQQALIQIIADIAKVAPEQIKIISIFQHLVRRRRLLAVDATVTFEITLNGQDTQQQDGVVSAIESAPKSQIDQRIENDPAFNPSEDSGSDGGGGGGFVVIGAAVAGAVAVALVAVFVMRKRRIAKKSEEGADHHAPPSHNTSAPVGEAGSRDTPPQYEYLNVTGISEEDT